LLRVVGHVDCSRNIPEVLLGSSIRVAVLIGSLRKESCGRKIARALIERAPKALDCSPS